MSAKYSTSPTLRLPIAESRICAALQTAFSCCCFLSFAQVWVKGYPWLAIVFSLILLFLLPALHRQPLAGAVVQWQRGTWSIEREGVETLFSLHPSSRASPLATYLCWQEANGLRQSVWLFADSGPGHQQRRLRVRLALEG